MSCARRFHAAQRTTGRSPRPGTSSEREGSARGQSHGEIMNELNVEPAFEARRLKSAPGWYVRVAWSHGKRDHIPGFISQQEALRWIETKARSWVSEQTARASFRGLAA
jgi:hypothetical protein